jgi:hypothetical protein
MALAIADISMSLYGYVTGLGADAEHGEMLGSFTRGPLPWIKSTRRSSNGRRTKPQPW